MYTLRHKSNPYELTVITSCGVDVAVYRVILQSTASDRTTRFSAALRIDYIGKKCIIYNLSERVLYVDVTGRVCRRFGDPVIESVTIVDVRRCVSCLCVYYVSAVYVQNISEKYATRFGVV